MNGWKVSLVMAIVGVVGCHGLDVPSFQLTDLSWSAFQFHADSDSEDEFKTTVESPLIGSYNSIAGLHVIVLEGVGLVTGLDRTGDDPPPSMYRTLLLEDMKKRGIHQPNSILRSPSTALVIVRAYLPPLIKKGDSFDVEVRMPGGGEATSLNGGWLMETYLSEQAIVPGRGLLQGHVFAKAKGPVLISTGEGDKASLAGVLRRGRVLGGGIALKERALALYVRNDYRSIRNARRIADKIGERFHHYNEYGLKQPLAEAKTDQKVQLLVHPTYADNFPRYLQVVRSIPFRETDVALRVRMQRLQEELANPATAERSAVRLEAIGASAIPILKTGLQSPSLEVRFHAACGLAYMGDSSGLDDLASAARVEPAFRVYALAAMAALDEPETHMKLRELMNESSAETRYGAFRALWTLDKRDPFIYGKLLNDQFKLHTLQTEGPPMVHLTHRQRAEVVLFGADQEVYTPLTVRAGAKILVTAAAGSETVTVSKFAVDEPDQRKQVSTRLADIITACAELGASYPDVVQMLAQAGKQHNLAGEIAIDALPKSGRTYYRDNASDGETQRRKARIGRPNLAPNLFPQGGDSSDDAEETPRLTPSDDALSAELDGVLEDGDLGDKSEPPASNRPKPTDGSDMKSNETAAATHSGHQFANLLDRGHHKDGDTSPDKQKEKAADPLKWDQE